MADPQRVNNVLQGLRSLQDSSLSIIRLSEPISATPTSHRTSDVSASAFDNPSPESLEADLSHYKVQILPSQMAVRIDFNAHRNSSPNSASPI